MAASDFERHDLAERNADEERMSLRYARKGRRPTRAADGPEIHRASDAVPSITCCTLSIGALIVPRPQPGHGQSFGMHCGSELVRCDVQEQPERRTRCRSTMSSRSPDKSPA